MLALIQAISSKLVQVFSFSLFSLFYSVLGVCLKHKSVNSRQNSVSSKLSGFKKKLHFLFLSFFCVAERETEKNKKQNGKRPPNPIK